MRKIRYCAAMTLDGYIAGPNGEYDWIVEEPEIDSAMAAEFARFDTALVGRRTFEQMVSENRAEIPGLELIVFSRTLRPSDYPKFQIVSEKHREAVTVLREIPGKDILLMGGGNLFRSLLQDGLVDSVEICVIPVLLGEGIPLLLPPAARTNLKLTNHRTYKSGIVALDYAVR